MWESRKGISREVDLHHIVVRYIFCDESVNVSLALITGAKHTHSKAEDGKFVSIGCEKGEQ